MAVEYKNGQGVVYFLHLGQTKTGKPRYYFARGRDGELAEKVPRGFEIYENPNGQVFLRKKTPKLFPAAEVALVKDAVAKLAGVKYFQVEAKKNAILVYLPDSDPGEVVDLLPFLRISRREAEKIVAEKLHYSPVLRFVLADQEKRLFDADRWCWMGSIDDWINLSFAKPLPALVKKYCPHLGKDSFYDLI